MITGIAQLLKGEYMFFGEKLTAKIASYAGETGKRKDDEPENLITISFSGTGTADMLAHINPSMRSRFYKKDDAPDMVGHNGETKLAMPELDNKFKLKEKVMGANVVISYGVGSEVVLNGCDVYAMGGQLLEGGNITYHFKIRTKEATAKDAGILHEVLNGREVDITLERPMSSNNELDV